MVKVLPSILSANFAYLAQDCNRVVTEHNNLLHFDVMDGVFVPNISFGLPVLSDLKKSMPQTWFDVHLMIQDSYQYIERFVDAGADAVTFHIEADSDIEKTIQLIHDKGAKAGLSLRPNTPIENLFPYIDMLDLVLVMSVEPGFGGQSFIPKSITRIETLHKEANKKGAQLDILVDGGINLETGKLCVHAGASGLVAGSAVFGHDNPKEFINQLSMI